MFAGAEEALPSGRCRSSWARATTRWLTVPNYQSMETVTLATGADVSGLALDPAAGWRARPRRARGAPAALDAADRGELPQQPDGRAASTRDLGRPARAVRGARHPPVLRRGLPRARARRRARAGAGGGPVGARAVARRDVEGLRPAGAADRLAGLPRPRAAGAARDAQALHDDLQRRPERADRRGGAAPPRRDHRAQPRADRRQPAALRRLLRRVAGAVRLGAPAGGLRLLPALSRRRRRRGVLRRPRARRRRGAAARLDLRLGARRRAGRPVPDRGGAGGPEPALAAFDGFLRRRGQRTGSGG